VIRPARVHHPAIIGGFKQNLQLILIPENGILFRRFFNFVTFHDPRHPIFSLIANPGFMERFNGENCHEPASASSDTTPCRLEIGDTAGWKPSRAYGRLALRRPPCDTATPRHRDTALTWTQTLVTFIFP